MGWLFLLVLALAVFLLGMKERQFFGNNAWSRCTESFAMRDVPELGWPLGEPACTCRRCCVKPLAERRWQSTHGRQALKKTAVPEPARELPLAKQARALRRPHAAGCPGRCAIAPAGWMANLWRGARGRGGTARHSTWSTSRGGSGKEILNARSSGTLP